MQRNLNTITAVYRYSDDKSDKFWRIEYGDNSLAVNYGKMGAIGKFIVKEFDDKLSCENDAKKLIASKIKKGYLPYSDFDADKHIYIDDEEIGLHPLTSHPKFRIHFSKDIDDIYYDCVDEEAPFGSDEGSDTLFEVTNAVRKNKSIDFASLPKFIAEKIWGMTYFPADNLSHETVEKLLSANNGKMNLPNSDIVTYATAFAQIKITGQVDKKLKEMTLNAIKRMVIVAEILQWNTTDKPSEIALKMINDLESFPT